MTRTVVIMGSGETTAGMLGVHREVFAGLPEQARCRLMDSPFAFQENAAELIERISGYFAQSLGRQVEPVTLPAGADPLQVEVALAEIRSADWVFAGPGSPSYARRAWAGTPVPEALAGVVGAGPAAGAPGSDRGQPGSVGVPGSDPGARTSGALVFASAAAVTLGDWSLPVYEIYKVGADPHWEPGLGLMAAVLGWRCAVVPHYDNKEGGTHDTRYCYLGERRLRRIEDQLVGGFILGVDEHTAVLIDLDAGRLRVAGRGGMTVRVAGRERVLAAGSQASVAEVEAIVRELSNAGPVGAEPAGAEPAGPEPVGAGPEGAEPEGAEPVGAEPSRAEPGGEAERERAGTDRGQTDPEGPDADGKVDADGLARVVLASLPESDAQARTALVALLSTARDAAETHDRELAAQAVQLVVDLRARARASGDWAASDELRDALAELGAEVRDTREGSTWQWR